MQQSDQAEVLPQAFRQHKKMDVTHEGGFIMKKSRLVKVLAMALVLVMLMSVTAFAASTTYFSVNGKTATGTCYMKSASTEYEDVASYIYAKITYEYRIGNTSTLRNNSSEVSNAAYSVHAYTDVQPRDEGVYVNHHRSDGWHQVNSSSRQHTELLGTM